MEFFDELHNEEAQETDKIKHLLLNTHIFVGKKCIFLPFFTFVYFSVLFFKHFLVSFSPLCANATGIVKGRECDVYVFVCEWMCLFVNFELDTFRL